MNLTPQHEELRRSLIRFIDTEINPHVDKWEDNPPFPAHEVFGKMGKAGFLGITKPEKFGGLGLDYSYGAVYCEALGHIDCGAIPMAIAAPGTFSGNSTEIVMRISVPTTPNPSVRKRFPVSLNAR